MHAIRACIEFKKLILKLIVIMIYFYILLFANWIQYSSKSILGKKQNLTFSQPSSVQVDNGWGDSYFETNSPYFCLDAWSLKLLLQVLGIFGVAPSFFRVICKCQGQCHEYNWVIKVTTTSSSLLIYKGL